MGACHPCGLTALPPRRIHGCKLGGGPVGLQGFVFGGFVFAAARASLAAQGSSAGAPGAALQSRQQPPREEPPAHVEAHFDQEGESPPPSAKERVGSKGTSGSEKQPGLRADVSGSMSLHGVDLDGRSQFPPDVDAVRRAPSQCSINVKRTATGLSSPSRSGVLGRSESFRRRERVGKLVGHWACVDTWGLEEFLRGMGVGKVKRVAASAAPWPSWDFEEEGGALVWVNHSALGDLREEIQVDGEEYEVLDGKKQRLKCRAFWEGEALVIERNGPQGRFREERSVGPDGKLHFVLRNLEQRLEATSWGRTFERRPPR